MPGAGGEPIAVVGAGPNGLAAAVELAGAGHAVVVHEAAETIGGGTRTAELTLPGFHHDVCSAVHPMGAGSPFFRSLPLAEHGLEWIEPPVLMAHPFDDGTAAVLERSVEATAASLDAADRAAYARLMDPFARRWRDLLEDALAPPIHLPKSPFLMAAFGFLGLRSALGLAESRFSGERARALFVGIAGHTLLPMDRTPSAAFGLMLAIAGHGPGWPIQRGGSQRIADALAAVLKARGGEIRTGSRVTSLQGFEGAPAVVFDLTPRQVLDVAAVRFPQGYRRRLAAYRYAPGVFKVDWALSAPIPWTAEPCRRAGTVHLGGSAAEIAASSAAASAGRYEERPFVLLTQPSLFDDSRAPAGKHTAWGYCHVPHGSRRDMTAEIEAQVERFAPGFRDVVLARHTMDTAALEARNANLVGGDINGGVQDLWQLVFRPVPRLDPYATPDPQLFLCSASTPPGGAVHGMCGYYAARSVLRRLR